MIVSHKRSLFLFLLLSLSSYATNAFSFFYPPQMPPYENVERAKGRVVAMQQQVKDLLDMIQRGDRDDDDNDGDHGGGGDGNQCAQLRERRECEHAGCQWITGRSPSRTARWRYRGYCASVNDDSRGEVRENDFAANLALQGMGRGLFHLAEEIDQALLVYGTPAFWHPWEEACHHDRQLLRENDAARVSARIPRLGLVTPADFDPIEVELQAVHSDLMCL